MTGHRRVNIDCSDGTLMRCAARLIAADAADLKRAHTLNNRWVLLDSSDKSAKAEYDSRALLVRELRARARMADTDRVP